MLLLARSSPSALQLATHEKKDMESPMFSSNEITYVFTFFPAAVINSKVQTIETDNRGIAHAAKYCVQCVVCFAEMCA